MALGTPVAAAAAYSANNGTSVSPAYPSGILATDEVLLIVGQKPSTANGGTVTTPTGWTLRESLTAAGGYGTTLGADTGNTNIFIYSWDTPVAGQTGNLSVTVGTNNICWAFMIRVPTDGGTIVYGAADGSRTTAPTSGTAYTVTLTNGTPATNLKSGDVAIWAMVIPTDVLGGAGFSAHTISATGTTFGTPAELNEPSSNTGNDIGGYSAWVTATAGSSTAAPTIGATATGTVTNVRGPIALIRLRELPFIDAASTTFSITGQNTTDTITRAINAEAGSFTYTGQDATLTKTAAPKEINAEAGSFSYTGQDATAAIARAINAAAGSFNYTGQDTSLVSARTTNAAAGSFSYTGQDAALTPARAVNAAAGSFSYTGQDATLTYTPAAKQLNAEAGAFTVSGQNATLSAGRSVNAAAGSFAYTGQDADLTYTQAGITFNAEAGSFSLAGQAAFFSRDLPAQAGSFAITGQDATLLRSYAFVAEAGAYGEADPYVDPGYVDPYYATNLSAALGYGRVFNAAAGAFSYTGQDATLYQARLVLLTSDQQRLLFEVYALHGLHTSPLVVNKTSRISGDLQQSIGEAGQTITIQRTAPSTATLPDIGLMIDELAALHGLTSTLQVTPTTRVAGSISQTMTLVGETTTVTRV